MRVLHLVHQYPPQHVGGTELYTQWLLHELQRRGHTVALFHRRSAIGNGHERRIEAGVEVWTAWNEQITPTNRFLASFGDRSISRAFTQALKSVRPDLVHIQHLMGLPVTIVNQLNAAKIPYIVTVHDYWFLCANAQLLTNYDNTLCQGPNWWLNCARCALARAGQEHAAWAAPAVAPLMAIRHNRLRRVLAGARQTIAPTNFVREIYREVGLPVANMVVIPHGIVVPEVNGETATGRQQPSSKLHVAYIGGISWQKGVHVLIAAINQLPPEEVFLSIYGDTAAFPDYVAHLKEAVCYDNVAFAGQVAHADLGRVLAGADIVAVPSLWYETSSLIIQEAFAAGVPVVASDLGAMREKVSDGVDGLLAAPGDVSAWRNSLLRFLEEPAMRQQMQAGMGPVRTVAAHTDDIEAIYGSALNRDK